MKPLLASLLFAVNVHAAPLETASRMALYGSMAVDLRSTWNAMPYGREGNPVVGQSRIRQAGVMVGFTVATDLTAARLGRKWGAVARFVTAGAHLGAAIHNRRLIVRVR